MLREVEGGVVADVCREPGIVGRRQLAGTGKEG